MACAIPSRWRIPIEYFRTCFLSSGSRPTSLIVFFIVSSSIFLFMLARSFKFLKPEREFINPGCSMTIPIFCTLSGLIFSPLTVIVPSFKVINPEMHLNKTDFPEPFRPIMPCIFPRSNCTLTFLRAVVSLNFFTAFSTQTILSIKTPFRRHTGSI